MLYFVAPTCSFFLIHEQNDGSASVQAGDTPSRSSVLNEIDLCAGSDHDGGPDVFDAWHSRQPTC